MTWQRFLRPRLIGGAMVVAAALLAAGLPLAVCQESANEREVRSTGTFEKENVWSLDFRFKDPRIIKVNIPGRGTRLCWYLWYQVINRTKEPRTFIPDFELVTLDYPGVYRDEVLPAVQEAIRKVEDPSGYHNIHNSVTIASKPIPPSKAEDTFPRAVTGVAIWDGSKPLANGKDLSESIRFSVFVSGLSNGWVLVDPVGGDPKAPPIVRRKTLQLNFRKVGDQFKLESREIQFVPPAQWVYRAATLRPVEPDVKKPEK